MGPRQGRKTRGDARLARPADGTAPGGRAPGAAKPTGAVPSGAAPVPLEPHSSVAPTSQATLWAVTPRLPLLPRWTPNEARNA